MKKIKDWHLAIAGFVILVVGAFLAYDGILVVPSVIAAVIGFGMGVYNARRVFLRTGRG